jgi:hypothetical protein
MVTGCQDISEISKSLDMVFAKPLDIDQKRNQLTDIKISATAVKKMAGAILNVVNRELRVLDQLTLW